MRKNVTVLGLSVIVFVVSFLNSLPASAQGIEGKSNVSFEFDRVIFLGHDEIDTSDSIYGYIVVVFGTLHNNDSVNHCVKGSSLVFYDGVLSEKPIGWLMDDIQDQLYPDLDYLGMFKGHCVQPNSSEPTFAAYDLSLPVEEYRLIFENNWNAYVDLVDVAPLYPTDIPVFLTGAYVSALGANIRSCPGVGCTVQIVVYQGEYLSISGRRVVNGYVWYEVCWRTNHVDEGCGGWIFGGLVKTDP